MDFCFSFSTVISFIELFFSTCNDVFALTRFQIADDENHEKERRKIKNKKKALDIQNG